MRLAGDDMIWAFAMLLRQGKRPHMAYMDEEWERTHNFEGLYTKYSARLGACKPVSPESDARLREFISNEMGDNDTVRERLSVSIGVLYWQV